MDLYLQTCIKTSRIFTSKYSNSFSRGISMLDKKFREPVYAVYGFVRIADEIVDTFHDHEKTLLLERYTEETYDSIERGISTNPVLHAFQWTVNEYGIERELIEAFFNSMTMDLQPARHDKGTYDNYIYGSAEVVGLMCLKIFYRDEPQKYDELKKYARKLGEAFQKVNFLRDISDDLNERERVYFPGLNPENFNKEIKERIEKDIEQSFLDSKPGIKALKREARFGVYLAYRYYYRLYRIMHRTDIDTLMSKRMTVSPAAKLLLLVTAYVRNRFRMI